jgi:hypothetical protein
MMLFPFHDDLLSSSLGKLSLNNTNENRLRIDRFEDDNDEDDPNNDNNEELLFSSQFSFNLSPQQYHTNDNDNDQRQ